MNDTQKGLIVWGILIITFILISAVTEKHQASLGAQMGGNFTQLYKAL